MFIVMTCDDLMDLSLNNIVRVTLIMTERVIARG